MDKTTESLRHQILRDLLARCIISSESLPVEFKAVDELPGQYSPSNEYPLLKYSTTDVHASMTAQFMFVLACASGEGLRGKSRYMLKELHNILCPSRKRNSLCTPHLDLLNNLPNIPLKKNS